MKRLNKKKNQLISLRDDEIFCPKCKGSGVVPNRRRNQLPWRLPWTAAKYLTCDKCLGDGKLDWVEQATGKVKEIDYVSAHTPSSKSYTCK